MAVSDYIGSLGVILLLLAFFLQLRNKIHKEGRLYLLLNFVGASLAGISAFMINFYPFVILEGTWAVISLVPLFKRIHV